MSTGIAAKYTGTLLLILLTAIDHSSQGESPADLRIMFYNVENLFDINDDPGDGDNEFLPGSLRRWNYTRYKAKLNSLGKTIIAAGEWEPPALVALCEIENRKVLQDLVSGTVINRYKYSIIHKDSYDTRGIDIGLIYRSDLISVPVFSFIALRDEYGARIATRDILSATVNTGSESFVLLVNHWPSRRGGVQATEKLREIASATLRKQIDSIFTADGSKARIIVMGDFNAGPADVNIETVIKGAQEELSLINLTERISAPFGTYKYQGLWETIDQVFVSKSLAYGSAGLLTSVEKLRVMSNDFLLTDDLNFPGKTPFSTWSGYRYRGGYSDHLPVVLGLEVRLNSSAVPDQVPYPF
jgi:predicted extracellular nuclease